MRSNYLYAVDRSDEYLAHYGIKGMKWGVRKAIKSGSTNKLDRQWRKANRKLEKLKDRADVDKQNRSYKNNLSKFLNATGAHGAAGVTFLGAKHNPEFRNALKTPNGDLYKALLPAMAIARAAQVGYGVAAGVNKYRTSTRGHEKAVNNLNDWQREMKTSFKGTKYDSKRRKRK